MWIVSTDVQIYSIFYLLFIKIKNVPTIKIIKMNIWNNIFLFNMIQYKTQTY